MEAELSWPKAKNAKDCRLIINKLVERNGMDSPLEPSQGTKLAHTLILDFWLPELWENEGLPF